MDEFRNRLRRKTRTKKLYIYSTILLVSSSKILLRPLNAWDLSFPSTQSRSSLQLLLCLMSKPTPWPLVGAGGGREGEREGRCMHMLIHPAAAQCILPHLLPTSFHVLLTRGLLDTWTDLPARASSLSLSLSTAFCLFTALIRTWCYSVTHIRGCPSPLLEDSSTQAGLWPNYDWIHSDQASCDGVEKDRKVPNLSLVSSYRTDTDVWTEKTSGPFTLQTKPGTCQEGHRAKAKEFTMGCLLII